MGSSVWHLLGTAILPGLLVGLLYMGVLADGLVTLTSHLPSSTVVDSVTLHRSQVRGVLASQYLRADKIQVHEALTVTGLHVTSIPCCHISAVLGIPGH